tara:strand:+ start:51078 stop:52286 length:1209 start_codon:yes stop_codon:yes gene_type:complete
MFVEFSSVEETVDAIARGEVVIVVDAEDRENEGDYICAAEKATPESMNLVLSGRGDFCLSVLPETAERLEIVPIVDSNSTKLGTAFMTPLDHVDCRTGVTAYERYLTVKAIADPQSRPGDFVRPGHVHTLVAKQGGVLRRAGHTEASVDLVRMAGLNPAAVLCEILDETGNRASRDDLLKLAQQQNLKIISIEQLIAHRRVSEKLVHRTAEAKLPTKYGDFDIIVYGVDFEDVEPVVICMGDLANADEAPLVRMHSSCFTGDVLTSLRCDCGDQLHLALQMISKNECGTVVYLPQEGRGIGLAEKIKAYSLQEQGLDTVEANHALGHAADMRDYGVGLQILKDLGLTQLKLLTNNPKKIEAFNLRGYNVQVVDQVPIVSEANEHNEKYLETKRDKMGHRFPR